MAKGGGEDRGYYTIGELAKLYHIGTDTIRYYERKGILEPVRGENGYRYYSGQSIWRMNVIRNLRGLGFSVDRIRDYFQNRTAAATEALLQEELSLVEDRLAQLTGLRRSVLDQLQDLRSVKDIPLDRVSRRELPPRRAFAIYRDHSRDEETDLLMKQLTDHGGGQVGLIGNQRLAVLISPEREGEVFRGVLLFDPQGEEELPGGSYLSVFYRGPTQSRRYLDLLRDYARTRGLELAPPFLEVIWLDIHTSTDPEEYISEIQARIAGTE